ncbi:hypothetical protein ACFLU1_00585 [Chloroflexota bacterium]
MADTEQSSGEEKRCKVCGVNSEERVLLCGEDKGKQIYVCVHCLPILIHG